LPNMAKKKADIDSQILEFLLTTGDSSSSVILAGLGEGVSLATVKRSLQRLVSDQLVSSSGQGRATQYQISKAYSLLYPVNMEGYFRKEIDERKIQKGFNHELMQGVLPGVSLFNAVELELLDSLHNQYKSNIAGVPSNEYNKELERLAIDLSWKSSQIEGNTYSLLETERLLKEKETAAGKTRDEATMLLNHKEALDFIISHQDYLNPVSLSKIEDIHSILIKELGVDRNIRKRRVGISGTNYVPLDNEHMIREAMEEMCELINDRENVFEKALLSLVIISYIQPFSDGNKRTARIISNAILMGHGYCPISFRTVDSIDYKKAMLIFYEQNNISAFKKIFIEQFEFAVNTYF
jgi:prophage maintenance system killer protein/predicted transcriptional regulator